ncbi:MAG: flagellin lysine-N-methylase [Oscillospiraceae bacterium]|nr:flagellin lysine-N-methylase [Oscillospiraceae bacterium]
MDSKLFCPEYYQKFSCIAGKCPESCCKAGWEIPIDDDTFGVYSCLEGDIGKKFKASTATGTDGDIIFKLDENGDCPFLNSDGLCDLYIATNGRLCEICTNYPRFFEEFEGFAETGVSISCPEAQRLILNAKQKDYDIFGEETDDDVLEILVKARQTAFDIVFNNPPKKAISLLIDYAEYVQDVIDFGAIHELDDYVPELKKHPKRKAIESLEKICDAYLNNADIMYDEFKNALADCKPAFKRIADREKRAYLGYLVFRYFLKAINTEDVLSVCKLIACAYIVAVVLKGDSKKLARLHAKEIEHDAENLEALIDVMQDIEPAEILSTIKLML